MASAAITGQRSSPGMLEPGPAAVEASVALEWLDERKRRETRPVRGRDHTPL